MPSSKMSDTGSFYHHACYTTDTFTSCIMIYEELLPYFEAKTLDDAINERLLNIGGMLTTLYTELTTLKNEITTSAAAIVVGDDKGSEPSVESNSVTQVMCEYNQQENIICEASTEEQEESNKEKVLNKLPKRNWEDVSQVLDEEHQRENTNHEDIKTAQTIPNDEKVHKKSTENLKKPASHFAYKCGNCKEAITVYNQDLDLSIALHNQDGFCRGKPSKLIAEQKERQGEKLNITVAQGKVKNSTKLQEGTNRTNFTPAQTNAGKKGGATHFSCIQPLGKMFICTICNKTLSGPKVFAQHLKGDHHQNCLKQSLEQKEIVSPLDAELFSIIKFLSSSLPVEMQYVSVVKGVITCNLCVCPIPPTVANVRDHVLGNRHSKNQAELQSSNKNCV